MKKSFSITLLFLCIGLFSCKDSIDKPNVDVQKIKGENILVENEIHNNPEIDKFIEPYKTSIEDEMNKVLSYSPQSMFKNHTPYNTAIGNMMADAIFELANPVFQKRYKESLDGVLINHGGIRAGINEGEITTRTAYNIMPFENMVVIAKLKGEYILEMFDYLSRSKKAHPISNMTIEVDEDWNLVSYTINGEKVNKEKTYYISTSDFLVNGGDNMNFFQKADTIYQIDYKMRNLFIDYFDKNDTIKATSDDRFKKL